MQKRRGKKQFNKLIDEEMARYTLDKLDKKETIRDVYENFQYLSQKEKKTRPRVNSPNPKIRHRPCICIH